MERERKRINLIFSFICVLLYICVGGGERVRVCIVTYISYDFPFRELLLFLLKTNIP